MRRTAIALAIAILTTTLVWAQIEEPVHWSSTARTVDDHTLAVTLTADIDAGWHLYGTKLPAGGPQPTTIGWTRLDGVKPLTGKDKLPQPEEAYDANFDMTLNWYTGRQQFVYYFEFTDDAPTYTIEGAVRFTACNDMRCIAPTTHVIKHSGQVPPQSQVDEQPAALPADTLPTVEADTTATIATLPATWAPVTFTEPSSATSATDGGSLWWLFALCVGGGLLALLTPCVWPIIPMTVSFFMKRSGSRRRAITDAFTYAAAIIVIYVAMGLLVTALFGPSTLNAIATGAMANLIFFALLIVFALSFFGAFELQLPDSWANKMDGAAERTTGVLSIMFMAFTLALVSFSCTGPIIGTLLVEAAGQGNRLAPAVGMLGFSLGLAVPFGLFAMFPAWLKKLPRSGSWMGTVKVILGFVELALSLKFLSVADLAYGWHILDREVFIALWIAIFGTMGFYLLGIFHFNSEDAVGDRGIGLTRFALALASLSFTAYLMPGLWGAPLRATSAFVPPITTQDFVLGRQAEAVYHDYDEALQAAQAMQRPVFVDFSGYGCVNCRKMEGAVLDKPEVKQLIADNFVSLQLMVDDKTALPAPRIVQENGKSVTLVTQGDLWSYLQRHKFGANSQPYYVVLDAGGKLLAGPFTYDEDIKAFTAFLQRGLHNHQH